MEIGQANNYVLKDQAKKESQDKEFGQISTHDVQEPFEMGQDEYNDETELITLGEIVEYATQRYYAGANDIFLVKDVPNSDARANDEDFNKATKKEIEGLKKSEVWRIMKRLRYPVIRISSALGSC